MLNTLLQTSLATLAASVDRRDWETATRNLQRAMAVDKAITTSAFAESVVVRNLSFRALTSHKAKSYFRSLPENCPLRLFKLSTISEAHCSRPSYANLR